MNSRDSVCGIVSKHVLEEGETWKSGVNETQKSQHFLGKVMARIQMKWQNHDNSLRIDVRKVHRLTLKVS